MKKFVKNIVIPAIITIVGAGASAGITYGITQSNANHQIEIAREQGYENAISDNKFYKEQMLIYKSLVEEQTATINDYSTIIENLSSANSQKETEISTLKNNLNIKDARIRALENENSEKESQVTNLTNEKSLLENRIETLQSNAENDAQTIANKNTEINNLNIIIAEYELNHSQDTAIINNLTTQKQELETQVIELQNNYLEKLNEITQLNIQVSNLQTQISTLQTTITLNTNTINSLNTQISAYQTQISNLQNEITNNAKSVKQYTDKISELEKTINYYEKYLSGIVTSEQSLVKFIFKGSVYNTQVVNNGTYALISNPENTPYITFNYWMLNGERVDPSSYAITENTEFVANLTYSYDVKFKSGETNISSQIIASGECPTLPEQEPAKDGFAFLGYSLNGIDVVDPTTIEITEDTIFVAIFARMHNVTFISKNEIISTQQVKDNTTPEKVELDNLIGWFLKNGKQIDLENYKVTEDLIVYAKFPVTKIEELPWNDIVIDGVKIILDSKNVWSDGINFYLSMGYDRQYILNFEEKSFIEKTWNGYTDIWASSIWSDGINYYISNNSNQYVLDIKTSTWKKKTWNGEIPYNRNNIWSDGLNIYYTYNNGDNNYILDKETSTWNEINFIIPSGLYLDTDKIWSDGDNIYYSAGIKDADYKFNKTTKEWTRINITYNVSFSSHTFSAKNVWSDGKNTYYSFSKGGGNCYIFDKLSLSWSKASIENYVSDNHIYESFDGNAIFSDGINYYVFTGNKQYIFY